MLTTAYLFLYIVNLLSTSNLYVTDGDTIKLDGERIRLTCIDAPEKTQPYGLEAKEHLMNLLKDKTIEVAMESKDQYGRTLAWLIVEGDTINNTMVKDGFAWWYEYYCSDNKVLEHHQINAKENKLGLWADPNPINPYEWRRAKRN
jgi:endonuclease YncB( thermonuclease family)